MANKKRSESEKQTKGNNGSCEPQRAAHISDRSLPTFTEKLAADTGVSTDTVQRRHASAQKLAAHLGVVVPSLEEATADRALPKHPADRARIAQDAFCAPGKER